MNTPERTPIIDVRNIHKRFRTPQGAVVHALNDVSLKVYTGEVIMIIGPSGSGKSTMLRCLNRLESFDSGSIVVDGTP
ncbi:MAG TPA: ATP-binding cassette domain-containing protein, partial [Aggregatilineales bacterium]|nr:ATP-binding cassette domain-containing protein [Aggregatilineales bacterium]